MIKINLTPFEELDNPQWWVPDVITIALVFIVTFGSVFFYIDTIEQEIAAKEAEKQSMVSETAALQGEVSKFNDLNSKIATLDNRKNSLKRITESKLVRYLPVILMENIQNLKPDKVWLSSLTFVEKKKDENAQAAAAAAPASAEMPQKDVNFPVTIEISGSAVDNVAIAEFMLALKGTQNQSFEKSDLRTQLFFSNVGILFSAISTDKSPGATVQDFVTFKLVLSFKEKTSAAPEGKFSQFIDQFNRTGHAQVN